MRDKIKLVSTAGTGYYYTTTKNKRTMVGNNVSHANNKTHRRFLPNLHNHRFWVESENRFVRLRVFTKGMRTIDKLGIDKVLADMRAQGQKV